MGFGDFFKKNILFIIFFLLCAIVFRNWFTPFIITAGDFWPQYSEQIASYSLRPFAWNNIYGLGGNVFFSFWNYMFFTYPFILFGNVFHLSYPFVERISFLFPLLILATTSSFFWARAFFQNSSLRLTSMVIYVFNTYALMISSGGQMGIIFAYFFTPIVFLVFMKLYAVSQTHITWKNSVFAGLMLGVLVHFDLRIGYIFLLGIFLYWIFFNVVEVFTTKRVFFWHIFFSLVSCFLIPITIAVLMHSFWIFPMLFTHTNPVAQVGKAYTSVDAVRFFSFARFENAVSLLHPNWPENIFGKVYFMRPEFLLFPLLAFASLLFIPSKKREISYTILFFALLGISGTFLAKGANIPFGEINMWLFTHVPGFVMFRDASKFYVLIALSYAVLIPWTLSRIGRQSAKKQISIVGIFLFLCICITIPQTVLTTKGILQTTTIPGEYVQFKDRLSSEHSFSRTLWVPEGQRFGYFTAQHPGIYANLVFDKTNPGDLTNILLGKNPEYPQPKILLEQWAVKYVVVPSDSQAELFLDDRKYSDKKRQIIIKQLDSISWLKRDESFTDLAVYTLDSPKSHFFVDGNGEVVHQRMVNPTEYEIAVDVTTPLDIIFSENFDLGWVMESKEGRISPTKTAHGLMSFFTTESGTYKIRYIPQVYVDNFLLVSFITTGVCIGLVLYGRKKKNKYLSRIILDE